MLAMVEGQFWWLQPSVANVSAIVHLCSILQRWWKPVVSAGVEGVQ